LNGHYNLFGQCDEASITLVKQIARMARDPRDDRPFRPVRINHVTIEKAGAAASKPATKKQAATASHGTGSR
jgi:peptidyl-prolyl cis-trans isomerase A (cyclophilin A)